MRDLEQDTDAIGDGACAKHLKADIRAAGLAGLEGLLGGAEFARHGRL
jgi:hypothetical protein